MHSTISKAFTRRETWITQGRGFRVHNFSKNYFFPEPFLQKGLESVVIFPENTVAHTIPNGSLWTYTAGQYTSSILQDDVGCATIAYHIPAILMDKRMLMKIVRIIEEKKIRIGHGNHFINITTKHPSLTQEGNMIWLHSDFNPERKTPKTYVEAEQRMQEASYARKNAVEQLIDALGLQGSYHGEWVHNTVEERNGKIMYRKGTISTSNTHHEGILLTNPHFGIFSYVHATRRFDGIMPHGTGKFFVPERDHDVYTYERVKGVLLADTQTNETFSNNMNSMVPFLDTFGFDILPLGYCMNLAVITAR